MTIANIETLNVATSSAAVTLNSLTAAAATSLVVTGDQNLTITTAVDFADATSATAIDGTVDASALTGNLTIGADTGDIVSFTGGSGNDTFAMTSGLATTDVLVGGAGTDTVSVTAVADDASLDLSTYNFTSIETFSVQGATGGADDPVDITIAADAAGISNLTLVESQAEADGANGTDEGTFTVTGLTSGTTIKLVNDKVDSTSAAQVSQIGAVTLSLLDGSATDDALTVELAGTTAQTAAENTVDDLAVTNVETLNIVSTNSGTGLTTDALTATDDNTLGDISTDTLLTTLNISGSDQANITVGSEATKLAAVNTSGMSDNLTLTLQAAVNQVVTGGAANETVAFGATLNNSDTVDLGAGTDVISATVTSSTATTGALSISNVETINLTNAGTSVIDASGIVGASEIAVLTNTTSTTLTGLTAGTDIGIGLNNTDGASAGLFDIALADSSGSADSLTFNLNDTAGGNTNAVELKASGIETVTLAQTDTTDTAIANYTFDVDSLNASKIIVTGANADVGNTVTLTALDTDTTTLDATGFYGILTTATGTATATTFDMRGGVEHNLTGSSKNDTFNFTGTVLTNEDLIIDGNGGTDVANILLGTGAQDFDDISDVDTLNFSASGTVAITTNADTGVLDGINASTKTTFTGGNSISTLTLGGSTDELTATNTAVIDLSGWNGLLSDATFGANLFDNGEAGITVQVIGTALADTVSASYDAGTDATVSINMQGVETFDVALADDATELRVDMALVTGLTRINVSDISSESVEFYNLGTGTTIDVIATNAAGTRVETVLADATGSADSQTFRIGAVDADDEVDLVAADIETINISGDTAVKAELDLSGISMTAATATNTVNFTGTNDIELIATATDIATIDASGMGTGGAVVQTGRTRTSASTYTGSAGADTFIMLNIGDTLNAGAGADTLDINATQAVGTAIIDLTASDQIASFNGGVNSAVQSGFVNVDLAGITSNGAVITGTTAANTIVGSAAVDQIDGGAGADTITGGDGIDNLTGGAGADTFVFSATPATNDLDVITDFVVADDIFKIGALDTHWAADLQVATLSGAGGTLTSLQGTATAADVDVLILLDSTGFANVAAAEDEYTSTANDITDSDGLFVVYYDSGTTTIKVAYDADEAADSSGGVTEIGNLTSLGASDLTDFAAANFAV
jgi:Ca2+-binding RTX toxin-like protein